MYLLVWWWKLIKVFWKLRSQAVWKSRSPKFILEVYRNNKLKIYNLTLTTVVCRSLNSNSPSTFLLLLFFVYGVSRENMTEIGERKSNFEIQKKKKRERDNHFKTIINEKVKIISYTFKVVTYVWRHNHKIRENFQSLSKFIA